LSQNDQLPSGDHSTYVTETQQICTDITNRFKLVDTVGLDYIGSVYDRKPLIDQNVAFVILLNSRRWATQQQRFIKLLGYDAAQPNMNFYLSFDCQSTIDSASCITSLNELDDLTFDIVKHPSKAVVLRSQNALAADPLTFSAQPSDDREDPAVASKNEVIPTLSMLPLNQEQLIDNEQAQADVKVKIEAMLSETTTK
jgi:hypothetical protein